MTLSVMLGRSRLFLLSIAAHYYTCTCTLEWDRYCTLSATHVRMCMCIYGLCPPKQTYFDIPSLPLDVSSYSSAQDSSLILLQNVACFGTEAKLIDCPHSGTCMHAENVGVICLSRKFFYVPLYTQPLNSSSAIGSVCNERHKVTNTEEVRNAISTHLCCNTSKYIRALISYVTAKLYPCLVKSHRTRKQMKLFLQPCSCFY